MQRFHNSLLGVTHSNQHMRGEDLDPQGLYHQPPYQTTDATMALIALRISVRLEIKVICSSTLLNMKMMHFEWWVWNNLIISVQSSCKAHHDVH